MFTFEVNVSRMVPPPLKNFSQYSPDLSQFQSIFDNLSLVKFTILAESITK